MGILLCKTRDGGEGVATWIYDGDDNALPPSDFFSPTGPPFALACTRRHATFPYVVQDTSASVFPFWGAR